MTSDSSQEKMPERVWLGVEQETVDGMPTGRDGDTYIEYEGWPEGTEYILASRFTALEAENERLRKALLRISSATVDDALKTAVAREALAADPPKPEKEAG